MNSLKTPKLQSINDHKLNPLSLILILNDESDESYADAISSISSPLFLFPILMLSSMLSILSYIEG